MKTENLKACEKIETITNANRVLMMSPLKPFTFVDEWYEIIQSPHFWLEWRFGAMLAQMRDLRIPMDVTLKALEIGCGNGILRTKLEDVLNWTIDGTDLNLKALSSAPQARGRTMYYNIFDRNKPLMEFYDVVILYDVLEHISETAGFLAAALYHLKPEGILMLNVPALQMFYSVYDYKVGHVRRYDKKTLSAEFKDFKFQILDMRYWGFSMLPLLTLRSLLMWFKRHSDHDVVRFGFKPPSDLVNRVMRICMGVEMQLFRKPFVGTSLLMVGRKGE